MVGIRNERGRNVAVRSKDIGRRRNTLVDEAVSWKQ